MDSARNTPDSHEDDLTQAGQHQIGEGIHSETWSFASVAAADGGSSSSTPHVSLFSPSVPPILPSPLPDVTLGEGRPHAGGFASPSPSRSLSSLGPSMAKRTARLKVSDSHAPIVQLQRQIPEAQKSGDDPTTPLENTSRKRTTMDLMRQEQTTMTSLTKLFSDSATMSGSRAPSYNNATGPLYLRGEPSRISNN